MEIILIAIIIVLVVMYVMLNKQLKQNKRNTYSEYEKDDSSSIALENISEGENIMQGMAVDSIKSELFPYHRKYLLTKNEYYFFKKLKPVADTLELTVLAKIRMADLVEVDKGLQKSEWGSYFGKIKSKHIDFALASPDNLLVKVLIELDDNSHSADSRKKRDDFIDKVYEKAGYKILHVYSGEQKLLEKLKTLLEV